MFKDNDIVEIEYVGRIAQTGEIFDLNIEAVAEKEGIRWEDYSYGPTPIMVGAGHVIKGLENAIRKMSVGEENTITLGPKEAFGERDPRLIKILPLRAFKAQNLTPYVGAIVDFGGLRGRVMSSGAGRVRVDFNSPLAGKSIKYHIKVISKVEGVENKANAVLKYYGIKASISLTNKKLTVETEEKIGGGRGMEDNKNKNKPENKHKNKIVNDLKRIEGISTVEFKFISNNKKNKGEG